jgi:hypothetical protein
VRLWEIINFEAVFIYIYNFFKYLTEIWLQIIKVRSVKRTGEVYFKIPFQNLPTVFAQAKPQYIYPYIYSECNIYALFYFSHVCYIPCQSHTCWSDHPNGTYSGNRSKFSFTVGDQDLRPYGIVSIIKNWKNFVLNNSRTSTERSGEEQILSSASNRTTTLISSDRQPRR